MEALIVGTKTIVTGVDLTSAQFKRTAVEFFQNADRADVLAVLKIGVREYSSRHGSDLQALESLFNKKRATKNRKPRSVDVGFSDKDIDEML